MSLHVFVIGRGRLVRALPTAVIRASIDRFDRTSQASVRFEKLIDSRRLAVRNVPFILCVKVCKNVETALKFILRRFNVATA